jgi:hypothetical protein
MKNVYSVLAGILLEEERMVDVGLNMRIMLKYSLDKWNCFVLVRKWASHIEEGKQTKLFDLRVLRRKSDKEEPHDLYSLQNKNEDHQLEEERTYGVCRTYGSNKEKSVQGFGKGKLEERGHIEDLRIVWIIILK